MKESMFSSIRGVNLSSLTTDKKTMITYVSFLLLF